MARKINWKPYAIGAVVILALAGVIFFWRAAVQSANTGFGTTTTPNYYGVLVSDSYSLEELDNDNGTWELWGDDISTLTATQLLDWEPIYANFALLDSYELDAVEDDLDFDTYRYAILFNGTAGEGWQTQWIKEPILGINEIWTIVNPTSIGSIMYSEVMETIDTFNETAEADVTKTWNILISTLDASALYDETLGYVPNYDFSTDTENYIRVIFTYNDTITRAYQKCDNLGCIEELSSDGLSIISTFTGFNLIGTQVFTFTFSEELGDSVCCTDVDLYFGDTVIETVMA